MDRRFCFLLILCCLAFSRQAQAQFDAPKTIEVGPHVGLSYYMGDINPTKLFAQSQLEYGGVARLNWDTRWSFRFDYSHVKVMASDAKIQWRPERGLSFQTKINDFSVVAEFNFIEYYTGNPKRNVSPYIFGGISVFQYTPYVQVGDSLVNLRYVDKETKTLRYTEAPLSDDAKWYEYLVYKSMPVAFSIPFGVGVKFSLSRHMAGTVEWRMQKTFTDYLDDVAKVYPENAASYEDVHIVRDINGAINTAESYAIIYNLSDPTAAPMNVTINNLGEIVYPQDAEGKPIKVPTGNYHAGQQRGNSAYNDWFGMLRVSLTWKFNLPDGRGCNLSKF